MEEKLCGRCKQVKPVTEFNRDRYSKSGLRSQCKICMTTEREKLKQHYKEWRDAPDRKAWYAEYRRSNYNPKKVKARNLVDRAIRRGQLIRNPCEVCGNPKAQAHHDDYNKPLDVRWLCTTHHAQWHKENKPID